MRHSYRSTCTCCCRSCRLPEISGPSDPFALPSPPAPSSQVGPHAVPNGSISNCRVRGEALSLLASLTFLSIQTRAPTHRPRATHVRTGRRARGRWTRGSGLGEGRRVRPEFVIRRARQEIAPRSTMPTVSLVLADGTVMATAGDRGYLRRQAWIRFSSCATGECFRACYAS
ncbi:hypothetical protein DFJ74DRAFT_669785 [Hyaloraphidium curvatum]|nr:hypothetical protein DFJ74DRAFT_669785 [Hyaloraphidium curvatum]